MKKNHFVLCAIVFLFLSLSSSHSFAFLSPQPASVSLYRVDDPNTDGIGTAVVQASLFDFIPSDDLTALLPYRLDDAVYMDWPGTDLVVEPQEKFKHIISRFQLFRDGTEIGHDTDGLITWSVTSKGEYHGLDAYSHAMIDWGDFQFQILSSNSNDDFASTPIPPGVLLLGAGLIGLIGFRRHVDKP